LLECTSANSNFGCWLVANPAAHKPTTTIFFIIIPSNVLLIRRRLGQVGSLAAASPGLGAGALGANTMCSALHTFRHLYSMDDQRK
jgi:hypothetical protein